MIFLSPQINLPVLTILHCSIAICTVCRQNLADLLLIFAIEFKLKDNICNKSQVLRILEQISHVFATRIIITEGKKQLFKVLITPLPTHTILTHPSPYTPMVICLWSCGLLCTTSLQRCCHVQCDRYSQSQGMRCHQWRLAVQRSPGDRRHVTIGVTGEVCIVFFSPPLHCYVNRTIPK